MQPGTGRNMLITMNECILQNFRPKLPKQSLEYDAAEIQKIDQGIRKHSLEVLDFLKSRDIFWAQISNAH